MIKPEELPSGRYRARYRDADGKVQSVPGTFERKSDAEDAAVDAQAKANRQAARSSGRMSPRTSWGDWWDVWNADREHASDVDRVEKSIVKVHLRPQWGDTELVQIKRPDVKKWYAKLTRECKSLSYANRIFDVFKASMNAAVDEEILEYSPCSRVKMKSPPKRPMPYYSHAEMAKITPNLKAHIRRAAEFLEDTGLRPSELSGLHAHRIDFESGWLYVAEVYLRGKKVMKPWPKDREFRRVPLTARAMRVALEALDGRDLTAGCGIPHLDGRPCKHPLVFVMPHGGVLLADTLSDELRAAGGKAGYALRRGLPTRLAEANVDPFLIARVMGHATVDQTNTYVQDTPASHQRITGALGDRPGLTVVGQDDERGTARGTEAREGPGASGSMGDQSDAG
ncbi:tyrosine-type recombinase/integrase [Labedaea rhizosphaerae]|uniref:Site-specific recombinase XerD n=1 Tax=Labedaea rhizosphaerae TaxID=598644 RepID=A0A4R6SDH6_LABRH|nr:tyrosine-type recombinase/integrase [Labedaea rhizosphaerae]TDP97683.1 site-specific recombinase XerD [Labedaea rhizosphaerae]